MARIKTFDDWVDLFHEWQKDIQYDTARVGDYQFEAKFGDLRSPEIEFGDYRGDSKWESVMQIPDQRIRDTLLHLIVYQGDTEFASVEQQRNLIETAPSEYDLQSLIRVNREEMRHGWQMSYLLVTYFGDTGKREAVKLLERRAYQNKRLLGSFNEAVNNWLDFFTYTQFVDRDGKYQLTMLSGSSFAPLARSMGPMLKEEVYHLLTGQTGLTRTVKAGVIPSTIVQKYFNKWVPTAYDLFGTDSSSSAEWSYVWGLKGRYDEASTTDVVDKHKLNERSRLQYHAECTDLLKALNEFVREDQPKLTLPDLKFHRKIGEHADKGYSVEGKLLSESDYARHLEEVLPGPGDERILKEIFKENNWILHMN
jgi:benzoyl-CoA 2,3-dioxygenase component B